MGLIQCGACQKEISKKAPACPGCGHPNKNANHLSAGGILATFIGLGVFLWWMAPSGGGQVIMDNAYDQVSKDAVNQYEIARRGGDPIQVCVHAGMVTAAYMQAKDEANYQEWLSIEKRDCQKAGMPQ